MTGLHQAGKLLPPNLPAGPLVMYSPPHVAEARHTPSETSFTTSPCGDFQQCELWGALPTTPMCWGMRELGWQTWMVGHIRWDHLVRDEGGWVDWKAHSDSNTLALLALIY